MYVQSSPPVSPAVHGKRRPRVFGNGQGKNGRVLQRMETKWRRGINMINHNMLVWLMLPSAFPKTSKLIFNDTFTFSQKLTFLRIQSRCVMICALVVTCSTIRSTKFADSALPCQTWIDFEEFYLAMSINPNHSSMLLGKLSISGCCHCCPRLKYCLFFSQKL